VEEAERKAIERELNNYMTEPCHFEGTDAEYGTILAYWSVRDFQILSDIVANQQNRKSNISSPISSS
jgi:hypothetical protein